MGYLFISAADPTTQRVSLQEFKRILNILSSSNPDQQLQLGFKVFDANALGHIPITQMQTFVMALCRAIYQTTKSLQDPFTSSKGVEQWVDSIYSPLQRTNKKFDYNEFVSAAQANPSVMSIFTLGSHLPTSRTGKPRSYSSTSRESPRESPSGRTTRETSISPESVTTPQKAKSTRPTKLPEDILIDEDDEDWTSSDSEGDEIGPSIPALDGLSAEQQNQKLLKHIESLTNQVKTLRGSQRHLQEEVNQLKEQNENLKHIARKYQRKFKNASAKSFQSSPSVDRQSETGDDPDFPHDLQNSHNTSIPPQVLKQIDEYHNMLCWNLQTHRIISSEQEIPPPPGKVERVDILMKRGDFIQNWKKRLFIITDKQIYYYREPLKPQGIIDMKFIKAIKEVTDEAYLPNTLELFTPQRVWAISFNNRAQLESWREILDKVCAVNRARDNAIIQQKRAALEKARAAERAKNPPPKQAPPVRGGPPEDLWA